MLHVSIKWECLQRGDPGTENHFHLDILSPLVQHSTAQCSGFCIEHLKNSVLLVCTPYLYSLLLTLLWFVRLTSVINPPVDVIASCVNCLIVLAARMPGKVGILISSALNRD